MIGEFEYLVLAVASRLDADAYGASMLIELERSTDRRVSIGALYTTLDRLSQKGLIVMSEGSPLPGRRGRPRRMVTVTSAGKREAKQFYNTVLDASAGTQWALK